MRGPYLSLGGEVMSKQPDPDSRRQQGMAAILVYLKSEFRGYVVSPFPGQKIKVRDNAAKVIHEVTFGLDFLDDHDGEEVNLLKEWGLVEHMRSVGPEPVWVSSSGWSS